MNIETALRIATAAHDGQLDRGGEPYILHPLHVAMQLGSQDEKVVAILHDVLEDTEVTEDDLVREGIKPRQLAALHALTKREGQTYDQYLRAVADNQLARVVKMADLEHNMDLTRLKYVSKADRQRHEKYQATLLFLRAVHYGVDNY